MAEPARKSNADIDPDIRPDLTAIPGGGETDARRGNLKAVQDLEKNPEGPNTQSVADGESSPKSNVIPGPWETNVNPQNNLNQPKLQKALVFAKKRGGVMGLIALFGVGGGLLAGLLGPASMLINLMENFSLSNDTSSTVLERRFMKAFGFATKDNSVVCNSKICNKMGKISNKGLYELQKKGIVAVTDGARYDGTRSGYPSKNPTHYEIDIGDGRERPVVAAKDLPTFLADNPKAASKVLGRSGAFNLRVKAWSGKYIANKFYKKFGLNRDGGVANGEKRGLTAAEQREAVHEDLRESIPDSEKMNGVIDGVESKVDKHLGKARKGGVGYVAAVAGCIAIKAPGYIAAGVVAVQLSQMLPILMDVVLSPGSKAKSVAAGSGFTGEDMNAAATLLTEKTPRASDGKMTSALDSPYLLAAIGVNKAAPGLSKTFTPGLAVLTNPVVRVANDVDRKLEPACNAIMSPAAMYSALAVDSAVTVAASATIIGGIVKVAASFAISEIAIAVTKEVTGEAAKEALVEIAENDDLPGARGEALGEVLGVTAPAFFSAGGMARNFPTLTESQLVPYGALKQENEAFNREMDIASLSPFDISSRYTFLGSMVHSLRTTAIASGNYNSISSVFSNLLRMPALALSPNISAAPNLTAESCGYADDFGLDTGDPSTTPAINISGMPCTGITTEQAGMTTSEATSLIASEGWLDETKSINDDDTIEDMVTSGYIKSDTPLADFIDSCSHPETGDYIFNSAGCTVNTVTKDINDPALQQDCVATTNDDGEAAEVCASSSEEWEDYTPPTTGVSDSRSLAAMSVLLIDYQETQIINGEDDEPAEGAVGEAALPLDPGYEVNYGGGFNDPLYASQGGTGVHKGIDLVYAGGSLGKPVYAAMSGVVTESGKGNGCRAGATGNNTVTISHSDGTKTGYMHMNGNDILVDVGDIVTTGQPIGKIGGCGQAGEPHLHFEARAGSSTEDWLSSIPKATKFGEPWLDPTQYLLHYGVTL